MLRPRTGSLWGKSTLSEWGTLSSLSQKSGRRTIEVQWWQRTENNILCSELLWCQQNFVKMLKVLNYTYSAWCTELCMSARGTLELMHHHDWCWIPQVRLFISAILFYCTTPPLQIGVGVLLFFAFYFLVSVIFLHILILSISNYAVIFLSSNCRIKLRLFLSGKLIVLATLSSMWLYCTIYKGILFMWTCWIQINTAKFWIGKMKFPSQCP